MDPEHEAVPAGVAEHGALAADRLGHEPAVRHGQARRVELDELEVGQDRAGAPGRRLPVPRRDERVGRLAVQVSRAARGEDDRVGVEPSWLAEEVEHVQADDRAVPDHEVDEAGALEDRDVATVQGVHEGPFDRRTGRVAVGVDDPPATVRGLATTGEVVAVPVEARGVGGAVEGHAEREQVADTGGSVGAEHLDGTGVRAAGRGDVGVGLVQGGGVVRAERHGHPALGVPCGAVGQRALRHEGDVVTAARADRGGEPGDPGPHDDDVHDVLLPSDGSVVSRGAWPRACARGRPSRRPARPRARRSR